MQSESTSSSISFDCQTPPRASLSSNATTRSSASVKRSLLCDKVHFRVENNPSKRASAACWKVFGLPAMSTEENPNKYEVLPGFASCKRCFETYKYIDSSTGNLNNHRCCQDSSEQSSISSFLQSPRSSSGSKQFSKRKEEVKELCAKWIARSMRPFGIVSDDGLIDLIQLCLDIGREFRSETQILAKNLLPCDRTVKNEIESLAKTKRNLLKKSLIEAAENRCLSISPDNWTDNHRQITYMGATAHFVDEQLVYRSVDLFCVEFLADKKSAENIFQLMKQQLSQFDLGSFIESITFVTDRGANFVKAFRSNKVLYCVVHRMNNILKRCFYQNPNKKSKAIPEKLADISISSINGKVSPPRTRLITNRYPQGGSPEIPESDNESEKEESETEEDEIDDEIDYTEITITQLPANIREYMDTIKSCKSLVRYVKKASMNRQLQLVNVPGDGGKAGGATKHADEKRSNVTTTLHQATIVRWLSLCDLLESIKKAYPSLVVLMNQHGQSARMRLINLDLVDNLIAFLRPWKSILNELQRTSAPSLFLVLPCITHLVEEMAAGCKREKNGIRFFYKRASQLISTMFTMEDDYIMGAFLHPNYKQLRGATTSQITSCHSTCRMFLLPDLTSSNVSEEINYEPPTKKVKSFIRLLMDKKKNRQNSTLDEVDRYIALSIEDDEEYVNPFCFWKQPQHRAAFPNLARLTSRYFSIPCSSATVERQFSSAGQIVSQRRSNLDPSTVNNIIFLRSIENNFSSDL